MTIEQRLQLRAGSIVHIDVGALSCARDRKLERRWSALLPKVHRISNVKDDVVFLSHKLARLIKLFDCVTLQIDVETELVISPHAVNAPCNSLDDVNEIDGLSE